MRITEMALRSAAMLALILVLAACDGDDQARGAMTGAELAGEVGCLACHTGADTGTAPSLNGIWGTEVELGDGRTVTVDDAYVRRSITDPGADIVAGYNAIMPVFPLEPDEVDRLVDWVRSLG